MSKREMTKSLTLTEHLAHLLGALPDAPGVYIFRDAIGDRIYIGKALSLRNRVRSYWNETSWRERPKLAVMMPKVYSFETIVTNSEKEALLLEATLVRQHMPRYNVHLKDDKRYPWLAITYGEPFPRLIMIRDPAKYRKENPKAKVFGPYVQTGLMWETVGILRKVFPLRRRAKPLFKDRPCLNYHIGLCLAPCQKLVEEDFYNHMVRQVEQFLSGHQKEAVQAMQKEMEKASDAMRFEDAAKIRDRINALQIVVERQRVLFQDPTVSYDIVSEAHTERQIMICMMRIREGKLIDSEVFDLPLHDRTTFDEAFRSFVEQYYAECEDISIPRELLLQHEIEAAAVLAELLSQRAHRQIKIGVPRRGDKAHLLEMTQKNASQAMEKNLRSAEPNLTAKELETLTKLKEELHLSKLPRRIECFDISNIQGTDNVASMVVFEDGQSKKSDYRLFKIRSVEGEANDFASMKEVVTRRYGRLVKEERPLPDLIIIDGGKGQLSAAQEAAAEVGILHVDMVGLAKRQEEVYFPGTSDPALLPRRSDALYLLQRVRDEAHRFAVTYHRKLRAKRSLKSGFDDLPNVGAARRKKLLDHFGSFDDVRQASLADLQAVPGIPKNVALAIHSSLHPEQGGNGEPATI